MFDVVVDEVGVDGDRGRGSGAGGGDDLGARVDDVAGRPDAGGVGAAGAVDGRRSRPRRARSPSRSSRPSLCGTLPGGRTPPCAGRRRPSASSTPGSRSSSTTRRATSPVDEPDPASLELRVRRGQVVGVGEEDDVVGPLAHELRMLDRARAGCRGRRGAGRGPPTRGSTGSARDPVPTARGRRGCRAARRTPVATRIRRARQQPATGEANGEPARCRRTGPSTSSTP